MRHAGAAVHLLLETALISPSASHKAATQQVRVLPCSAGAAFGRTCARLHGRRRHVAALCWDFESLYKHSIKVKCLCCTPGTFPAWLVEISRKGALRCSAEKRTGKAHKDSSNLGPSRPKRSCLMEMPGAARWRARSPWQWLPCDSCCGTASA